MYLNLVAYVLSVSPKSTVRVLNPDVSWETFDSGLWTRSIELSRCRG